MKRKIRSTSKFGKTIYRFSIDGVLLQEYGDYRLASKWLIDNHHINMHVGITESDNPDYRAYKKLYRALTGKTDISCGFRWSFVDNISDKLANDELVNRKKRERCEKSYSNKIEYERKQVRELADSYVIGVNGSIKEELINDPLVLNIYRSKIKIKRALTNIANTTKIYRFDVHGNVLGTHDGLHEAGVWVINHRVLKNDEYLKKLRIAKSQLNMALNMEADTAYGFRWSWSDKPNNFITPYYTPVYRFSVDGELLQTHLNRVEAADWMYVNRANHNTSFQTISRAINRAVKGKLGGKIYGFIWSLNKSNPF